MTLAFCSNYLNHHQLSFCLSMRRELGDGFSFIATTPVRQERLDLGYADLNKEYPFVIRAYEDDQQKELSAQKVNEADVVVIGSAPREMIQQRLSRGKLTFIYSERIYKTGYQRWKWPLRAWRYWRQYGRHKNCYLLCASAYAAGDFAKTYTFINKAYKWGYFPDVKRYESTEVLMLRKRPATIIWAGRFIDWKHPELVVEVAKRLKEDGYAFQINMLGNGTLHDEIKQMIRDHNLEQEVHLLGAMPPENVRKYMEESAICLFTSDRNEGWGAVLNEAMNSGCAVVANHAIGSVPFLLEDGRNGFIYENGNELYKKVKRLIDNHESCVRLGEAAYMSITELWNAETASNRLIDISEKLLQGEKCFFPYVSGPCSKAPILRDTQ